MPIDNPGLPGKSSLAVNDIYRKLKRMTVLYEILPGERINELEYAARFGISRSPLREALNRLAAENLLDFKPNKGFYTKKLTKKELFDLYQLRKIIELGALRIALDVASDSQIQGLNEFWVSVMNQSDEHDTTQLLDHDEQFHMKLAAMSGNAELVRSLGHVNDRIRFVRWVDLENAREDKAGRSYAEHHEIVEALNSRDKNHIQGLLANHIERRMEEISELLHASVVQLYAR